jgi:hypothetical protein
MRFKSLRDAFAINLAKIFLHFASSLVSTVISVLLSAIRNKNFRTTCTILRKLLERDFGLYGRYWRLQFVSVICSSKMKSSFTKFSKGAPVQQPAVKFPPGTRPSVQNGQLLISTGLHELDGIFENCKSNHHFRNPWRRISCRYNSSCRTRSKH